MIRSIFFILLFSIQSTASSYANSSINDTCQDIFLKLKRAKGLDINQPPYLSMVDALPNDQFRLAMADNEKGMIYFENSTAELVIREMGDQAENAIAYMLAHEMAHITYKHNVRHQFIAKFQKGFSEFMNANNEASGIATHERTRISQETLDNERDHLTRKNEAEADLDAGFTAYLAGYETKVAGPQFLDLVYSEFSLNPTPNNYPSLVERKSIVQSTGEKIDTLVKLYDMGNYLTAAGEYTAAYECYNYVAQYFTNAKLLNNLGVAALLELTETLSPQDVKYFLPITLSFSDGKTKDHDGMAERKILYDKQMHLINTAITHFERANLVNPYFYESYLNKSIALYLSYTAKRREKEFSKYVKDDLIFALGASLQAKQILLDKDVLNSKAISDVYAHTAILYHELGDSIKTHKFSSKALRENSSSFIAKNNQYIFTGEKNVNELMFSQLQGDLKLCQNKEQLSVGKSFNQIYNEADTDNLWNVAINIKSEKGRFLNTITRFQWLENQDYEMYCIKQRRGTSLVQDFYFYFFMPKNIDSFQSACGIEKGSAASLIKPNYGKPSKRIETDISSILRFIDEPQTNKGYKYYDGLLFLINEEQKVENWIPFEISKPE